MQCNDYRMYTKQHTCLNGQYIAQGLDSDFPFQKITLNFISENLKFHLNWAD